MRFQCWMQIIICSSCVAGIFCQFTETVTPNSPQFCYKCTMIAIVFLRDSNVCLWMHCSTVPLVLDLTLCHMFAIARFPLNLAHSPSAQLCIDPLISEAHHYHLCRLNLPSPTHFVQLVSSSYHWCQRLPTVGIWPEWPLLFGFQEDEER
jgi:hypothetical protein